MATSNNTVRKPGIFANIGTCFTSLTSVVVTTCRTAEKTVNLVENEVDGLAKIQKLRLDDIA